MPEQREIPSTIRQDIDKGVRLCVGGTPTIFLNGRVIPGVQPVESFVLLIQDELTRGQ